MGLIAIFAVSLGVLLGGSKAEAWGARGHQIVSYVGADVSGESFWVANVETMRTLSTVPDRLWKDPKTKKYEGPTHFFQADAYVEDINRCEDLLKFPSKYSDAVDEYGPATIQKNGTAPWRIVQMYDLALSAFRRGDMETGVQMVGMMSHYIGDLSQPLHVSENYDGKQTGQSGIHSWFESSNIGNETKTRLTVTERAQALLQDEDFLRESSGPLADVINHEVVRSLEKRDEVLQNDARLGRKSAKAKKTQLDLAEDRMADGAAVLAIVLQRLTKEAGLTRNTTETPVDAPEFVMPDYGDASLSGLMTPLEANPAFDDDCDAP
jgi:hypothetical protein